MQTLLQVDVRRAEERGKTELGWLHSRHAFSFGRYYDPENMGYRSLRVLNDDVVDPGGGFGEHGHDNMEILTWVLQGALRHADSTGSQGVIQPGELQVMSAGRGIRHSEMNASSSAPVHLLQVWIVPTAESRNREPSYSQKAFAKKLRTGSWQTLASRDRRHDLLPINQDAVLSVAELTPGQSINMTIDHGRHGFLHIAFGAVQVEQTILNGGDAAKIAGSASFGIRANEQSQILHFDLS